ncbi:MAG TPA: hypothetical protein VHW60_14920 [Caulobacteraceae bacterium]|jgi:hypothetical protein|nr:hypothetical protein [Caulobacteraceae bacterium]
MLKFLPLALAAAAVLAVGLPAAAAPGGQACFRLSSIENTKMQGERTLFMRSSTGAYYRMDFGSDCTNAGSETLVLHPTNNSDEVCGAIGIDVHVRATGQGCIPTNISRLTPDEVAAIPASDKP